MIERIIQITLVPQGQPIFSEQAFVIQIEDDAGGEYISVKCYDEQCEHGQLRIDPSEWEYIKAAVDKMVKECREEE